MKTQRTISIKTQTLVYLAFIVALSIASNVYSIQQSERFIHRFDDVQRRYYAINDFLTAFTQNTRLLEQYMAERNDLARIQYAQNEVYVREVLAEMTGQLADLDEQSFLLVRAINNTHATYAHTVDTQVLAAGGATLADTASLAAMAEMIDLYTKQLLETSLSYGQSSYRVLLGEVTSGRTIAFQLMWVGVVGSLFFSFYILRRVLNPIVKLSDASMEIAKSRFDIPDLDIDKSNEIGLLTTAFNKMKRAMQQIIEDLKERQRLAQKLYEEELKVLKGQTLLEEAKLSLLQSQINPHFLFNTLNVISSMAETEQAAETGELIRSLSRLFRYNLESDERVVSIARELIVIRNFVYIEKKRFGDRLLYKLRANVDLEEYLIPTFTLQPIVENSILHGVLVKEYGGAVRIKIYEHGEHLIIRVTDNGVGMDEQTRRQLCGLEPRTVKESPGIVSGIGIGNVSQRVKTIYPGSVFHIRSKRGWGTCVEIRIRLEACRNVSSGNRG